ncbi:MAG TPA: DUF4244 domain-containing protein [Mycobacteriales bacterium]|nr:DUF4244 domain-containing protein [Mycobacteriales bacterium]
MSKLPAHLPLAPLRLAQLRRSDDGVATAEYAMATVAACGFAGILATLLKSKEVQQLLMHLIQTALTAIGVR